MVSGIDKKAAIAAYKERKAAAGIYAVRCTVSGEVWVGQTPTLDTVWNRLWFTLGHGVSRPHSLQTAWSQYGDESFVFEELERLEEEENYLVRKMLLKKKLAYWQEKLKAQLV
ncbi:GIY-YIG nuclease family protein [Telmatospirillum sp.]|uniref:GIY-YIG nuclease family protein n=1 Tax=Telmatospirillum sp. TaxID=2079197 RepID=UPI00284EF1FE|nr:GIY-YIG nuclease family protein [Telmatospirillum sp.]MDR3440700.1 GIY-YIG nuclease family protein [Telmatospirillum sp.]